MILVFWWWIEGYFQHLEAILVVVFGF